MAINAFAIITHVVGWESDRASGLIGDVVDYVSQEISSFTSSATNDCSALDVEIMPNFRAFMIPRSVFS